MHRQHGQMLYDTNRYTEKVLYLVYFYKVNLQRIVPEAVHSTFCLNMVRIYKYSQAKNQVVAAAITKGSRL